MGQDQSSLDAQEDTPVTPVAGGSRVTAAPRSPQDEARDELSDIRNNLSEFLSNIGSLEYTKEQLEALLSKEREEQSAILFEVKEVCEKRISTLQQLTEEFRTQAKDTKEACDHELLIMQKKMNAAHKRHVEELAKTKRELEHVHALELSSTRKRLEDTIAANEARHADEMRGAAAKSAKLAAENADLKQKLSSQVGELAAQLTAARQDAAAVRHELADKEQAYTASVASLNTQLQRRSEEVMGLQDHLTRTQLKLAEAEQGNEAMAREVRQFRKLLDTEISRITPSKKRKTASSLPAVPAAPGFGGTPSASDDVAVDDYDDEEDDDEEVAQQVTSPSRRMVRRGTMDMTAEAGKKFMGVLIANIDHKKECIVVQNKTQSLMEIGGWKLVLEKSKKQFLFPPNTEIAGGSKVTVWCGKKNEGRSFNAHHFWWSSQIKSLANKAEKASLENARGFVASKSRGTPLR